MNRRLVVEDGRSVRELLLVGTIVVGRDPQCEISHADPRLSRRHAEFTVGPEGVTVRDLDSRNGIRVNGRPVKEAALAPGDVVQIAQLNVRLVEGALENMLPSRSHRRVVDTAVTIAASLEDDRTRMAPTPSGMGVRPSGAVVAATPGGRGGSAAAQAPPDPDDDRTRLLNGPAPARPSAAKAPDVGEVIIRERPAGVPPPRAGRSYGVRSLLTVGWGRRAIIQGVLLAAVVFLVATFPLIAWQSQTFGVSAAESLIVLVPAFVASVVAGVLVAGLIARTVAQGVQAGDRE
ncbi:MAG TPA: FHA domain-containing protein [Vicinamibacterales bacterium]|nr:FHA domain-containing protein [Vicinamibacterales bacterium]